LQTPPVEGNFLTTRLWDRYLPKWRDISTLPVERNPEMDKHLVEYLKAFAEAPRLKPDEIDFDLHNPDAVTLERRISKRRGNWWQLPKDLSEEH